MDTSVEEAEAEATKVVVVAKAVTLVLVEVVVQASTIVVHILVVLQQLQNQQMAQPLAVHQILIILAAVLELVRLRLPLMEETVQFISVLLLQLPLLQILHFNQLTQLHYLLHQPQI